MRRAQTPALVLILVLLWACADDAEPTASTETSTTTTVETTDATFALSATECANTLGAAIGEVDISRVDATDGLSPEELADLNAQLDAIEVRMPDVTVRGRCVEHLRDPEVAFQAIDFAPEATILVIEEIPGIYQRGVWGLGLTAWDRAFRE